MPVKDCGNLNNEIKDARYNETPNLDDLIKKNKSEPQPVQPVVQVVEKVVAEETLTTGLTLSAPKNKRDVKIVKSTRIDKSTVSKVEEIIFAYKFFNSESTLSFNEVINVALEEWASKKEHIDLRNKVDNVKKMLK